MEKSGDKIKAVLQDKGVDFVEYVDVSQLPYKQNKGFPTAILFGVSLSTAYLDKVSKDPNYVSKMRRDNLLSEDEFNVKEIKTDGLADYLANYLSTLGYSAYSQSEANISSTGFYDEANKNTPLPHKTIAGLAGLGWIGKHNLLVTQLYGSAISMCTVLTDAPLETVINKPASSKCGDCNICVNICPVDALKGNCWEPGIPRNEMVDVGLCKTCLRCMVLCPWTQKYMNKEDEIHEYKKE